MKRNLSIMQLHIIVVLSIVLISTGRMPDATAQIGNAKSNVVSLADGKIMMRAPTRWVKKKPRVRIVEYEFALPKSEGDKRDGRLTMMGAGGSVQANIDRWISQFSQPDVKKTENGEVTKKMKISGQSVYYIDISGTYLERRGPFAPATSRKDYRMLGAIIKTENYGQYFCKCYGPAKTIEAHEDAFLQMLKTLKVKE